jgi:putative ABC transport system permease protein
MDSVPRFARLLLALALHPDDRECALADLEEEFECHRARAGNAAARRWYRDQVWRSLAPALGRRWRSSRERQRRLGISRYLGELRADAAFSLRQMAAAPGFTFVAVATLALGIGATTAIFSAVVAVVLRPLPVPAPERLVVIGETWRESQAANVSAGNFVDMGNEQRVFVSVAAAVSESMTLARDDGAERLIGGRVSGRFFELFGVPPALGRVFGPEEDEPGHDQVVVLSHRLWTGRFGGNRSLIGQAIVLDARPHTVIGVMPPSFDFTADSEALWIPIAFTPERRAMHDEHFLMVYGRLRAGVTLEQARSDLDAIGRRLARRFPQENGDRTLTASPLMDVLVGDYKQRLLVLFGAVAFVLLIACGNVSNLLLARGTSRATELAVRSALGAGQSRLVRQLVAESLVLGLASAVAGIALACVLIGLLVAHGPAGVPRLEQTHVDVTVLAFTALVALVASVAAGLMPAVRASRADVTSTLRAALRGAGGRTASNVARSALIIGEVALAVVLLVGAGLLIRSAVEMQRQSPGFNAAGVFSGRFSLPPVKYRNAGQLLQATQSLDEAVSAIAGVESSAVSTAVPGFGGFYNGLVPEGEAADTRNVRDSRSRFVSPGYFRTMELPILRGRAFTDRDRSGAPLAMIVNQTLADQLFPGQDPIGRRVTCCTGAAKTIVGVAMDVRALGPAHPVEPEFYLPLAQLDDVAWSWTRGSLFIVARRGRSPATLGAEVRRAVSSVDPGVPLFSAMTMEARLARTVETEHFNMQLLALLGAVGLLLASIGIYGVSACFAAQRTPEIGIRMALGASRSSVVRLVVGQAAIPMLAGVVIGTIGALFASRLLASELVHVRPTDVRTYAVVVCVLVLAATLAALVPARQAASQDPARTLSM